MTSFRSNKALLILMAISLGMLGIQAQTAMAQAQKGAAAQAQAPKGEEIPPDSDYMTNKYRVVLDDIKAKEADPAKRADALLTWVKANPRATKAISYAASLYGESVAAIQKSDAQKGLAMIEAFQATAPNDRTLITMQLGAYYNMKNYPKAAEIGEKLYAEKPSPDMANTLYLIYSAAANQDKMLVYGEKLVADVGIEKGYGVALQMAGIQMQRKNSEKAVALFSQVMALYGDKVPAGVQEAAWNQVRSGAYIVIASDSYAKKDFTKAAELYEKVAGIAGKSEEACQAWYYIGMSKWQSKDQKGAIEPFAKAMVLGKTLSPKAKEYFEQLYKNEHSGSLDGSDAIIAQAKKALGIS
jgi:tetratricopeptide (TPR) repeat protein